MRNMDVIHNVQNILPRIMLPMDSAYLIYIIRSIIRPSYNYYDFLSHQYPRERMSGKNWTEFRNQPKALLEYIISSNIKIESLKVVDFSQHLEQL